MYEYVWRTKPCTTAATVTSHSETTQPPFTLKSYRNTKNYVISHNNCDSTSNDRREVQILFKDYSKNIVENCWVSVTMDSNRALDYPLENGSHIQMRLSYSPVAHLLLFLVQWTDWHLAGALGLLRILVYMTYADGKTTMSVYERKASIRDFYSVIFPSLLQLQMGITDLEERKQREICSSRYRRREEVDRGKLSQVDIEREEECGICLEKAGRIVLPNCCHSLCLKCYQNWRERSLSCLFCRDNVKKIKPDDLWVYTDRRDVVDMSIIQNESCERFFMYIDKLPLVVPDAVFVSYDYHCR